MLYTHIETHYIVLYVTVSNPLAQLDDLKMRSPTAAAAATRTAPEPEAEPDLVSFLTTFEQPPKWQAEWTTTAGQFCAQNDLQMPPKMDSSKGCYRCRRDSTGTDTSNEQQAAGKFARRLRGDFASWEGGKVEEEGRRCKEGSNNICMTKRELTGRGGGGNTRATVRESSQSWSVGRQLCGFAMCRLDNLWPRACTHTHTHRVCAGNECE